MLGSSCGRKACFVFRRLDFLTMKGVVLELLLLDNWSIRFILPLHLLGMCPKVWLIAGDWQLKSTCTVGQIQFDLLCWQVMSIRYRVRIMCIYNIIVLRIVHVSHP